MCGEKRAGTCETLTALDSGARYADIKPHQGDKIAGSDFEQLKAGPKGEPQGCGE